MARERHYVGSKAKIGIVCDTILFDTIRSAAEFIYVSPTGDWREKTAHIDCFLAVSTWRGLKDDEWEGVNREDSALRQTLYDIIEDCRRRGIPTVFYSKEDPPNYDLFLGIARRCDVIFTSAVEMVPRYSSDCGHDRVHVLGFVIDPAAQNPIGCLRSPKKPGVLFSGSWARRYPDRCKELKQLFDGVLKTGRGLCILDRNSYRSEKRRYRFPERFQPFVHPSVPHGTLAECHKSYDWSVNINTVTDSSTMFAGRCYELLACGCPLLSNYSYGMSRLFPAIAIAHTAREARDILRSADARELHYRRVAGIRAVMSGATCHDFISAVLKSVGIDCRQPERRVAVVADLMDERVRRLFDAQTYKPRSLYDASRFNEKDFNENHYIALWSADGDYPPTYLEDRINAFKFADIDFAGDGDPGYEYVPKCRDIRRAVFRRDSLTFGGFEAEMQSSAFQGLSIPPDPSPFVFPQRGPATVATVVIEECEDVQMLHLRALASLRRSRFWGRLAISCTDVTEGSVFRMSASDEVIAAGFDKMLETAANRRIRCVSGGVLMCGRTRRLVKDGIVIECGRRRGASACIDEPVLARYVDFEGDIGEPWPRRNPPRPNVFRRVWSCFTIKGFWRAVSHRFLG